MVEVLPSPGVECLLCRWTAGRWQVSKVFGCICEDVTDGVKRDHASLSAPHPSYLFIIKFFGEGWWWWWGACTRYWLLWHV